MYTYIEYSLLGKDKMLWKWINLGWKQFIE